MLNEYYRVSIIHTFRGSNDAFVFWGENSCGYQQDIRRAGLYDNSKDKLWVTIHKDELAKIMRTTEEGEKYLPNIGDYRKFLGISVLDLSQVDYDDGVDIRRDYFIVGYCRSKLETVIEKFKKVKRTNLYRVFAKDTVSEFWYMDDVFEAKTRSQAINRAFTEWTPMYDDYIDFKKDMRCHMATEVVFDGWEKR